jgi:hypothetical protein
MPIGEVEEARKVEDASEPSERAAEHSEQAAYRPRQRSRAEREDSNRCQPVAPLEPHWLGAVGSPSASTAGRADAEQHRLGIGASAPRQTDRAEPA